MANCDLVDDGSIPNSSQEVYRAVDALLGYAVGRRNICGALLFEQFLAAKICWTLGESGVVVVVVVLLRSVAASRVGCDGSMKAACDDYEKKKTGPICFFGLGR